jgi:WD40 repeat protein
MGNCFYVNDLLSFDFLKILRCCISSEEHTASVQTVQFCPWDQGLHLAAGSTDGTISILSYNTDKGFWSRKVIYTLFTVNLYGYP